MRLKDGFLAVVFLILVVSVVYPRPPATHQASQSADLTLQMWDSTAAEFGRRIGDYVRLRTELEDELPALAVTDDPAETRRAIRALAQSIRAARRPAAQGDVFKSDVSNPFKKALLHEMDASTCAPSWTRTLETCRTKSTEAILRRCRSPRCQSTYWPYCQDFRKTWNIAFSDAN